MAPKVRQSTNETRRRRTLMTVCVVLMMCVALPLVSTTTTNTNNNTNTNHTDTHPTRHSQQAYGDDPLVVRSAEVREGEERSTRGYLELAEEVVSKVMRKYYSSSTFKKPADIMKPKPTSTEDKTSHDQFTKTKEATQIEDEDSSGQFDYNSRKKRENDPKLLHSTGDPRRFEQDGGEVMVFTTGDADYDMQAGTHHSSHGYHTTTTRKRGDEEVTVSKEVLLSEATHDEGKIKRDDDDDDKEKDRDEGSTRDNGDEQGRKRDENSGAEVKERNDDRVEERNNSARDEQQDDKAAIRNEKDDQETTEMALTRMRSRMVRQLELRGGELGRKFTSLNFPSLEAALISLAFLTFAVFLIDLVQYTHSLLIHTLLPSIYNTKHHLHHVTPSCVPTKDLLTGNTTGRSNNMFSSRPRTPRGSLTGDGDDDDETLTDLIVLTLSSLDTVRYGGDHPDCGKKLLCHLNRSGWHSDGIIGTVSNYFVSLLLSLVSPGSGFEANLEAAQYGRESEGCSDQYSGCPSIMAEFIPKAT
ncbi:hypothetical protein Pmani_038185 [Petrolisthes manimaculis]|uniref:Uncharacterized protein n=1 Tax=Petrolisthes manimaculis TaxID=1843537 RepID=A0AAE1TKH9_9EUCA|nr:hypothetical protein Pmani_038185 [Petrolisthes manimaculis]